MGSRSERTDGEPGLKFDQVYEVYSQRFHRMVAFFRAYPDPSAFSPPAVAKLPESETGTQAATQLTDSAFSPLVVANLPSPAKGQPSVARSAHSVEAPSMQQLPVQIPWSHHVILLEKVKDLPTRLWYMEETIVQGWSRNILTAMIESRAHDRQGKAVTNFAQRRPSPQSDLAAQTLKDPYIFDFLTLEEPFRERELETVLVAHVQKFLLEQGQGFAFVGRQYRLEVGDDDFYLDLLFYHLHLRCFIVVDLLCGAPHKSSSVANLLMWLPASSPFKCIDKALCVDHIRRVYNERRNAIKPGSSRQGRFGSSPLISQFDKAFAFISRSASA